MCMFETAHIMLLLLCRASDEGTKDDDDDDDDDQSPFEIKVPENFFSDEIFEEKIESDEDEEPFLDNGGDEIVSNILNPPI